MDELKNLINGLKVDINKLRVIVEDLEERIEILEGDTKAWLTVNAGGENDGGNQTLIQAAPDMYEALKAAEEVLEGLSKYIRPSQYKAIKMIGDALEKAEGRK